jgi:hypothetical protein
MKNKPTYAELLRDPRWQRRRLEIMERDNFTCLECNSHEKTLNVHHCYYESGLMPWEYPDDALKTLCQDCHEIRQMIELKIQKELAAFTTSELSEFSDWAVNWAIAFGVEAIQELIKSKHTEVR